MKMMMGVSREERARRMGEKVWEKERRKEDKEG